METSKVLCVIGTILYDKWLSKITELESTTVMMRIRLLEQDDEIMKQQKEINRLKTQRGIQRKCIW